MFRIFDEHQISSHRHRNARNANYLDLIIAQNTRPNCHSHFTDLSLHGTCFIRLQQEKKAELVLTDLGASEIGRSIQKLNHREHRDSQRFTEGSKSKAYNWQVERKIFWIVFALLGLIADFVLPLWWALAATIPIGVLSWWIAYRSDWF
jgi:hypothetical protein